MKYRNMIRIPAVVAVLWTVLPDRLWACSVCFGSVEGPLVDGLNLSVIFMLLLTYTVIGGFVGFFVYLRRRERLFADSPDPGARSATARVQTRKGLQR